MKYKLAAALAFTSLAACAQSAPPPEPIVERGGKPYQFTADPGALVAVDIAFQRAVRADGFAKAAKDFAAKDAQLLATRRVSLDDALKTGVAIAPMVKTETAHVTMSCDGRTGAVLTRGTDAASQTWGVYTIWNKAPNGQWRWSLLTVAKLETGAFPADSVVSTFVAKCGSRPPASLTAPAVGVDMQMGLSPDQTLSWTSIVEPKGVTRLQVRAWNGTAMEQTGEVFSY